MLILIHGNKIALARKCGLAKKRKSNSLAQLIKKKKESRS